MRLARERMFSSPAQRVLAAMLVLSLVLVGLPTSSASQELVNNGGFETRNFNGGTVSNAKVRASTASTSGRYYELANSEKVSGKTWHRGN